MGNPLLLVVGVSMGVSMLYFWYCEMFSDGYIGWFERFFNRIRWWGKNFTALSEPAAGLTACFGCIAALGTVTDPNIFRRGRDGFSFWEVWALFWGVPTVLCAFLIFVGFIPFSLPEWMYPEYHAAKREEQRRREAAERGEALDRNPFLDDDGVYASQLGNVPVNTPPTVGLPSTGDPRPSRARPKQRTRPSTTPAPPGSSTSPPLPPHCPAPGRPPATAPAPSEPRAPAGADRRVATHRRRATPRTNLTAPTKRRIRRRLRRPCQCHLRNRHRQSHRRHVWIIPRQAWREPDHSVGNRFRPWDINPVA